MGARPHKPRWKLLATAVVASLVVSGCATAPSAPEPVPVNLPPQLPKPVPTRPAPAPQKDPVPVEQPPPQPPTLAVVLANRSPAYEDVAIALGEMFDDISIYDLTDKSQPPESAFRQINDGDTDAVVAIGLRAATTSVSLAAAPVVFSQVFNYQDFDLLSPGSRGIAAIASPDAQLAAWKDLQPTLDRVGIVIGPGHEDLLADAELAADRHGIALRVSVARSDQEALFQFKRMVQDIDGFWLLPDNRILSARVLREMMSQANRRSVTVLVPSRAMLAIGATISISTVASDIAERIRDVVVAIDNGNLDAVPPITPLSEILVETDDERLGKSTASAQASAVEGADP